MKLFDLILALHIAGGGLSLLAGMLVLILKKGGKQHRLWGNLFYYGMVTSGIAALALSVMHPNVMLFCIGVFSMYLVLSGKRVLHFRSTTTQWKPGTYDYILMGAMLIFGLISMVLGGYNLIQGHLMGIVLTVFGGIGFLLTFSDFRAFRKTTPPANEWLKMHLTKMIGGYIATTTAFLVVNNTILPDLVVWLLPTILGSALITKWRMGMARIK